MNTKKKRNQTKAEIIQEHLDKERADLEAGAARYEAEKKAEAEANRKIFVRQIVEKMREGRTEHSLGPDELSVPVFTSAELKDFADMVDCYLETIEQSIGDLYNGEPAHDHEIVELQLMTKGIRYVAASPMDFMCSRGNRTFKYPNALKSEENEKTLEIFRKALQGYGGESHADELAGAAAEA